MQLRAHLPTLLQLALQPTKDVVERQPALPKGLHALTAHAAQALRLNRGPPRNIVTPALHQREQGGAIRLIGTSSSNGA